MGTAGVGRRMRRVGGSGRDRTPPAAPEPYTEHSPLAVSTDDWRSSAARVRSSEKERKGLGFESIAGAWAIRSSQRAGDD